MSNNDTAKQWTTGYTSQLPQAAQEILQVNAERVLDLLCVKRPNRWELVFQYIEAAGKIKRIKVSARPNGGGDDGKKDIKLLEKEVNEDLPAGAEIYMKALQTELEALESLDIQREMNRSSKR